MAKRILSTLVLWSVILGSLWLFGGPAAVALLTILSVLTLHELYGMADKLGGRPFRGMGLIFSIVITAGPYVLAYSSDAFDLIAGLPTGALVLALIVCCFRALGERDSHSRIETIASTMLGLLYVPFMLHFLVAILMRDGYEGDNLVLCLWTVAVSKFCDVGALLTGLAFGKHKMAPVISPKKTWEGAVGGVLISKKRVVLLGATGSIGENTLRVIAAHPRPARTRRHRRPRQLGEARRHRPRSSACARSACSTTTAFAAARATRRVSRRHRAPRRPGRARANSPQLPEADIVLVAVVGTTGLEPALAALAAGKDLALASKEILVLAGKFVLAAARRHGVKLLPVDSEHNAVFQCLEGHHHASAGQPVRRIVLTASGGAFRDWPAERLAHVTPADALRTPTGRWARKSPSIPPRSPTRASS
jgi:CDP-diglyceride synthetase